MGCLRGSLGLGVALGLLDINVGAVIVALNLDLGGRLVGDVEILVIGVLVVVALEGRLVIAFLGTLGTLATLSSGGGSLRGTFRRAARGSRGLGRCLRVSGASLSAKLLQVLSVSKRI